MKRTFFLFIVVINFLTLGCGGSSTIKTPETNNKLQTLLGDEVLGFARTKNGNNFLFREGESRTSLSVINLSDKGNLLSSQSYSYGQPFYFSDDDTVVSLEDNTLNTVVSRRGFVRIDQTGEEIDSGTWENVLGIDRYDNARYLSHFDQGYCIYSGSDPQENRIYCLDKNNTLTWQWVQPAPQEGLRRRIPLGTQGQDGTLYLWVGEGDQYSLRIQSPVGDLQQEVSLEMVSGLRAEAIRVIDDKLVLAAVDASDVKNVKQHFITLNKDGSLYSTTDQPGGYISKLIDYQDGSYLVLSQDSRLFQVELSRIDIEGNIAWKTVLARRETFRDTYLKLDPVGNAILMSRSAALSFATIPPSLLEEFYFTRISGQGKKMNEHLVVKNQFQEISASTIRTIKSGFIPQAFLPLANGYLAAGYDSYETAMDNPNSTSTPYLIVNEYRW